MAKSNPNILRVASVVMVLAIGFVMQNVLTEPQAPAAPQFAQTTLDGFVVNEVALTAAPAQNEPVQTEEAALITASLDTAPDLDLTAGALPLAPKPDVLAVPQLDCEPSLTATATSGAMVDLSFEAACMPQQRVTFHHNGMIFTQLTDVKGVLNLAVPALSEAAVFIADAGDGKGAVAHAIVPDLARFDRAVVQWRGAQGIQLHALEFGAGYSEPGHIWREASVAAGAGRFDRLGETDLPDAYQAEIYSFDKSQADQSGEILLSVEAEVLSQTCGQDVLAETLQIGPDGQLLAQELTMSMPECDAIGDFLLLKNLLQDLTIAAN